MNFKSLAALLALAASALAQANGDATAHFDVLDKPEVNQKVPAGKTFQIVWQPSAEYNDDTVSLHILGGESFNTLQDKGEIVGK